MFATAFDPATFLGGFVVGMFLFGMAWIIYIAANGSTEHKHEAWIGNKFYSTRHSHRIFGIVGERIADGHWINWIKSVWQAVRHTGQADYFLLHIDEFNPPNIIPVTPDKAKSFIREHAKEKSHRIIRDWFGN